MKFGNLQYCFRLSALVKQNVTDIRKSHLVSAGIAAVLWSPILSAEVSVSNQAKEAIETSLAQHFEAQKAEDWSFNAVIPEALFTCNPHYQVQWRDQPTAGKNTALLSCPDTPLQAYISVLISQFKNVVIAATSINRGEPLAMTDLAVKRMDIGQLRLGYFQNRQEITGWQIQRTIKAGQVLTPYIVKPPVAISRGDWVRILAGNDIVQVSMMGEALKDGAIGEQIPVRNLRSKKHIKAWVVRKGVVSTHRNTD